MLCPRLTHLGVGDAASRNEKVPLIMRYITLASDFGGFSLRDDQGDVLDPDDLDLASGLVQDLLEWNARYQTVIPMTPNERQDESVAALIAELDGIGLELANRVANSVGDSKVSYYSEGLLRRLQGG